MDSLPLFYFLYRAYTPSFSATLCPPILNATLVDGRLTAYLAHPWVIILKLDLDQFNRIRRSFDLKVFGKTLIMDDKRHPTKVSYCHLEGTRTWMDNVRRNLANKDMDIRIQKGPRYYQRQEEIELFLKRTHRRLKPDGREKLRKFYVILKS